MKVLLYSYPFFLDTFLLKVEALSKIADVQVIIELAPENWKSGVFDIEKKNLKSGFYSAFEILGQAFPKSIKEYWRNCTSFNFFVFDNRRSVHPDTWRQAWILTEYLRKSKADIIHFDGVSLRIAPFLWRLKRFPIVLNVHDSEPHSGEDDWRRRLSNRLARNNADHFILHSTFSKNEFISQTGLQPARTSVIPLGELDIFRHWMVLIEKEEKNNVLFFGRLSPYKGLDIFLKAASIVAQKIGNCKFVIAGRPIQNYTIPSLPDLPRGSTFTLQTEYIASSQLCKLMQQASLVVCPYIDASQSGVVLTAYAFNKPVVATNVGGIPEYIEDGVTGKIVPLKNPEALADAIIDLLSNADLRNQMSETIKTTKNKWSNWNNSALEMMNIYKKLVPEGNCE